MVTKEHRKVHLQPETRQQLVPSPVTDTRYFLRCDWCARTWHSAHLRDDEGLLPCPYCGRRQIIVVDVVLVPRDSV